jgi:diguanylate cyclase (GGDEF)-like protein
VRRLVAARARRAARFAAASARRTTQLAEACAQRSSLIGEILALQLVVAVVVGSVAFAGLWWASSLVVRDQMRDWGAQWLDNLDELGAPLYLSGDEKYASIDSYVDQFAEILFVRYYSDTGEPTVTRINNGGDVDVEVASPVGRDRLEEVAHRAAATERYLIDTSFGTGPLVRIVKPVVAKSVSADGLLGFDPDTTEVEETLLGYVELGLDFSGERAYLSRGTLTAVSIGIAVLVLLTTASWLIYRRALRPLSALQDPLARLARGNADFSVVTSGHREIVAIADAMNATTRALDERKQRLNRLEGRDQLTALPNRSAFHDLLEREIDSAEESGRSDALLFLDLDQFKYLNDSCGHAVGDRLLKLAAERLQKSARPQDVVARFGGDEYVMLLRGVTEEAATEICAGLVGRIKEETFREGSLSFNMRCSIGAVMIRGDEVRSAQLLRRAEQACRQAKSNGRNQFCFWSVSSKEIAEMKADAVWSQKIQAALKRDSFVLFYQPIVDVRTGRTTHHEVLVRMLVDGRIVAPGMFLPAAARLGLVVDIDRWVIRQSLRRLAELRAMRGDMRFTLNVSGSTFDRAEFFTEIETELEATGVPFDAIVIEITEQIAMRDIAAAAERMSALSERGCRFAIDDFGSGYCSYSYLKDLPVAFVKIDGRFIAHLADDTVDRAIVGAIAGVATAANCQTIAEHVEDYETLRLLEGLGVTYAQGFGLGRPSAEVTEAIMPEPYLMTLPLIQ